MSSTPALNDLCTTERARISYLEERNRQLLDALGATTTAPLALHLTRHEAVVAGMLLARPFVTRDGLYTVMYGEALDAPDPRIVDVWIFKLRRKLGRHGISITTQLGEGWFLDADSRAELRAIYDQAEL